MARDAEVHGKWREIKNWVCWTWRKEDKGEALLFSELFLKDRFIPAVHSDGMKNNEWNSGNFGRYEEK